MNRELNGNLQQNVKGQFVFTDGLKILWGTVDGIDIPETGVRITVDLPVSFNADTSYIVMLSQVGGYPYSARQFSRDTSSFDMTVSTLNGKAQTDRIINWLAIGY